MAASSKQQQQRRQKGEESNFPIPSSLQDLEREPYNLFPYPDDFDDRDDSARAESFETLVRIVEQTNQTSLTQALDSDDDDNDDGSDDGTVVEEPWMDRNRLQALYTLVRKSTSLAPETREGLIAALCQSIGILASALKQRASSSPTKEANNNGGAETAVPQAFRDTFACHVYLAYSLLVLLESQQGPEAKLAESQGDRQACAGAMLVAAETMADCRTTLFRRGVPDEAMVLLPCRIAYRLLERATGVVARRAACGDAALQILAVTVNAVSESSALTTVAAALMDLMHSYEHMAPLIAELCGTVIPSASKKKKNNHSNTVPNNNRLTVELLREVGRLDGSESTSATNTKASGIRNVAPFLPALASLQPRLVLQQLSHVLPHLQSESYYLRSAFVHAATHILEYMSTIDNNNNEPTAAEHPPSAETSDGEDEEEDAGRHQPVPLDTSKSREALLDVLADRVYDVSSYTRAAALKAWISLTDTGRLPKERLDAVTKLAIDRLQDKTVVVRKQAMHLLTTLLESNPFLGSLEPKPYREKLLELYLYVKENMPANIKEAHELGISAAGGDGEEEPDPETVMELEQAALAAAIAEAQIMMRDSTATGDDLTEAQQEYCVKVQALVFTQSALDFIDLFEDATVALEGMLLSANNSDVTEALRFFVKARHFQLPCAVTGMKRALALMWSSEQSIRDEVLKAFVDVFIAEPGTEGGTVLPDNQIAKNLLVLVGQASVSELASVEEAIHLLVLDERIPADVFLILWSIASKGNSSGDARAAALRLISMGAGADRSIVDSKSRLKLLLEAGLGEYVRQRKDWRLAGAAASALQRIGRAKVDPTDAKYLVLELIMEELCAVARGDGCDDGNKEDTLQWFSAAEQAIKALFVISPEPEKACRAIILGMQSTTLQEGQTAVHSLRLARFFHVMGHVALNLLVYTEALTSSVRHANAMKSLKRQEEADKAKARKSSQGGSHNSDDDCDIEAELGVAAEVEAETERSMAEISETEILSRGLISVFSPLLVRVVANEGGQYNSEILRQASMLALCKFMCVSSSFCEKHLPLLFTQLANAPPEDTTMRANTVVALGDLAFRFPNELEPYTPRMYACLRDTSTKVRRHTLMVLTHLILNDMVKVKGQVCEIALCLRDDDPRIRDMSRLLFHELSKRSNNPIYNLLPDIISQLSQLSMRKEDFRSIMAFLLGYIKKERQNEMLAEKLCLRFPKSSSISQKADLAYCLAQLKINEKAVKCLCDNFKMYKDALFDEDVKKNFLSIVTKAKKSFKPESRQLLEEWEAKINESSEAGMENEVADEKASRAKARASKKNARKQKQQQRKKTRQVAVEEEEEEEEEENLDYAEEDEDEGNDDDDIDRVGKENTVTVAVTSATKPSRSSRRPRRRNIRAVVDDDSDDE